MFKDVTDLRYYSRRRATDNPVALDLLLVGAEGVGALLALKATSDRGGATGARRQQVALIRQARQVLDEASDYALITFQEGIARTFDVFARRGVGQLLRLIDVHFDHVAQVLRPGLVATLPRDLAIIIERLARRHHFRPEHHVREIGRA